MFKRALARIKFRGALEDHNRVRLGLIALVVITAVVGSIGLVGAVNIGKIVYRAEFSQAASVRKGDQVTVAGIPVGKVESLKLVGDRVDIALSIDRNIHLGGDTKADIRLTTLLGSRYIEVTPGRSGNLANRTIPLQSTVAPYDLQSALADATTTFDQIDADQIAESMTTASRSLHGLPEALPAALRNLRALSQVVSDRRDQIGTLLASADKLTTTIKDQKANLGLLVRQGRDLLNEIVTRRAAVERLFDGTTDMVAALSRILKDAPALNDMLASVRDFSRMIAEHDALFRNTLQVLPIALRNAANASGSGTAIDGTFTSGPLIDSWMCAISGRAEQFGLVEYFEDCA
ncbi:Mce family protein, Mce5C [Mycobacteroides abscessus subsp. abscessus]|nr:Mce family protein, Mce5C [Mycobacteroides abscessus subsp. abscessus]SKK08839.1 Putative MCE family protein [Mycobacteroides abscessus subsp. bolletii]SKT69512.1 Putative MCE family protein [Mycobacteroides abscessus subsp. massiliense]SHX41579.1 Mce family protein, Mce5C [Mycobacteroides abscessus subsp. abscessus]SIG57343.1 Mce family protein, Mce5C [Mycobacteroides abscessus subsp. abscessus]